MADFTDLTGHKFGMLMVVSRTRNEKGGAANWICRCDCGGNSVVRATELRKGRTQSCGCRGGKLKDITGQKFGRLTVLSRSENASAGGSRWLCKCDCGNKKTVRGDRLRNKEVVNCGCIGKDAWSKHGKTRTPEYKTWAGMKSRCFNPNIEKYRIWGGRGITICDGWRNSFEKFLADMGERPSPQHSIDRIDNDGNYSCGHCAHCRDRGWNANCRWATPSEQNQNQQKHTRK